MKKLQAHHYFILLAICVAILTVAVALAKGKEASVPVIMSGVGSVIGLTVAAIIRKRTGVGKTVDEMIPQVFR